MNRTRLFRVVPVASLLFLSTGSSPARAGWPLNGAVVCDVPGASVTPEAASDGAGGIIVAWEDFRGGTPYIYAQRLDAHGVPQWTPGGVLISSQFYPATDPRITADGAGGAIIVWTNNVADFDLAAQRIDASGNTLWQTGGVTVCAAYLNQQEAVLVSDGSGGAYIAWEDVRSSSNWDIYAQHLDATGSILWPVDGLAVCNEGSNQRFPCLALGATGSVFVAWQDQRNAFQWDIFVERIDAGGYVYWNTNVCSNAFNQLNPRMIGLDIGGAVVVWEDYRTGNPTTFAQRITNSSFGVWASDGVQVCTAGGPEYEPQIVADNDHGAVVVWRDLRAFSDIYAQRLDAFGARLWTPSGVLLGGPDQQTSPRAVSDGAGGAYVSWVDQRYDQDGDIYACHVDGAGLPQGIANGTPIASLGSLQLRAPIVSDGAGGAVMAWEDYRTGNPHIYAQRLERFGNWGYPSAEIVSVKDVPGDQGGRVNVAWSASRLDPWPSQTIDRYTVWRSIDAALATTLLKSGASPRLSAGAIDRGVNDGIRVEATASGTAYWQLVGTVDAFHLASYAFAAPTLFDSTATSAGLHTFQVIAHHDFGNEYWISNVASGRSIDNLAPAAPLMLTAQRAGSDVLLRWNPSGQNEADFSAYAIYRASSAGVQPLPGLFVTDAIDTLVTDTNPPAGFLYYIVTARDTHGNQSTPSNEAAVTIPTGIGDRAPAITRLTLDANFPNPFSAGTDLRVGLPRASDVRVEVYDVAGRRVAVRQTPRLAAGWQSVAFDGRDARGERLASGVYFYRITAAGETRTSKMVIGR